MRLSDTLVIDNNVLVNGLDEVESKSVEIELSRRKTEEQCEKQLQECREQIEDLLVER